MFNFDWLSGVSQETAKMIFLSLYALIGILVLILPTEYVYQGIAKEDRHWWNNLKLWSIAVLCILASIYNHF
ncbi:MULTISPECIES: hypothetical protein [unclassified Arenibacter]|uniref:hypothetical protein n=1 Tax=unclassified Arenibacter TaxID=2615047 RepID=UPI000E3547CB|nr:MULTISPECIES: hypothetical protein [unclassified Arenibacter]MCM4165452.1 hypothetical protein [Arenibacter sp. A80]RFT54921.1 hypothetical protein D0S24_17780 [Arenibacter sp. P308M17]